MKIKVSYSELVSGPGFNNRRAEAELEVTVENNHNLDAVYQKAWDRVKGEVKRQLGANEDIPF
ncbi:hypothetical protein REC12_20445 [Desulfosporosinus sp. PR]|uniref:hypothetical protein n=1 Tax=Candidatus Desulfosporosinus nitrosoreducens TaxID=3401928 RepID=UPI0027ED1E27|nr:hypothetical protein [Desulfosporosinus sp. PR]MDQ7095968.1 hypothetical protein [Desulfosporosinus sp. PR]